MLLRVLKSLAIDNHGTSTSELQLQLDFSNHTYVCGLLCFWTINMVFWNLRNRADTTDANLEDHREGGEEESRTVDPVVEPETHRSHGRISSLLEHVRRDLDIALQAERWTEANQLLWTLQAVQVRKDRR